MNKNAATARSVVSMRAAWLLGTAALVSLLAYAAGPNDPTDIAGLPTGTEGRVRDPLQVGMAGNGGYVYVRGHWQ